MKRILMGIKAWQAFERNVTPVTDLSGTGLFTAALRLPVLIGTPLFREPYLAPDDVWIEYDDGSWERIAPCST